MNKLIKPLLIIKYLSLILLFIFGTLGIKTGFIFVATWLISSLALSQWSHPTLRNGDIVMTAESKYKYLVLNKNMVVIKKSANIEDNGLWSHNAYGLPNMGEYNLVGSVNKVPVGYFGKRNMVIPTFFSKERDLEYFVKMNKNANINQSK